jgi:hypothetical protein
MLFYMIGRKSDKKILEMGFRSVFDAAAFLSAVAANYGGIPSDYIVYTVDESDAKAQRINRGDAFTPAWTGAGTASAVSDIDFTTEDTKKILRYATDQTIVIAGGASFTVTVTVILADSSGVDIAFGSTVDIPVRMPDRTAKMRFAFVKGVATRTIIPADSGTWIFPSGKFGDYRNENSVSIEIIY